MSGSRRGAKPIRKHQCLELNVSHNRQPVQGDKGGVTWALLDS